MKSLFSYLLIICFSLNISSALAEAEESYEIKIRVEGLKDTTFFLSNFYAKNQYYRDTARSDGKGNVVFKGKGSLDQGMYSLVLGNRKIFDFFVIEQNISFETDTVKTIENMVIKGSKENQLFYDYMRFLGSMEKKARPLQEKYKNGTEDEKIEVKEQLNEIDVEVKTFVENFINENAEYFVAKFIKAMKEIEIPDPPKDSLGHIIDSNFQYRYFREHYFDNLDFSDARFLRTPVYHQKLSSWIQKYTYQIPDSLIRAIDQVVNKSRANEELFRYTVSWITNTYEKSNIMGMDAIFVHMAEFYYLTDDVDWIDSTQKGKIKERYVKTKPLLIGKVAPNIVLADSSEKVWYNLHDEEANYMLVYIWSPTCGHCKKVTPKMHKLYLKYKEYGFKVFAVSTEYENKEWKKYIETNNLTWINVSDSPKNPNNIKGYPLNFRANYDVFSTPKIYLIDKDKKIVAKRIEDEQLDDFLGKAYGLAPKESSKKNDEGYSMDLEE